MTADELEAHLARLRAEWPVGSMVEEVMARVGEPAQRMGYWRGKWPWAAATLAAAVLIALVLPWLWPAGNVPSLQAAVERALDHAQSARLVITSWDLDGERQTGEIWYRRGSGFRAESPDEVLVDNGRFLWKWRPGPSGGKPVVVRQPGGSGSAMIARLLDFPATREAWTEATPKGWKQQRAPELDRRIDGRPCQAYVFLAKRPQGPAGTTEPQAESDARRVVLLLDPDQRILAIKYQRRVDRQWIPLRETRIEYDIAVAPERLEPNLPTGAQVVDAGAVFDERYPLEKALARTELGGLLLAVHEAQPLEGGGCFIVSSVRGTPAFLRQYPPQRRVVNLEYTALDVASHWVAGTWSDSHRVELAMVERNGVEFLWWLLYPRRYFRMVDGKRVLVDAGDETDRRALNSETGKIRIPLGATYLGKRWMDEKGVSKSISTWIEVPLPRKAPPTTLASIAAQTRSDVLLMRPGTNWRVYGATQGRPGSADWRRLRFDLELHTHADYAEAIRKELESVGSMDELKDGARPPSPASK
jgi:hypothetical protein